MKTHLFIVSNENKEEMTIKLTESTRDTATSFEMEIIEGNDFFKDNDYLKLLLSEIAVSETGEGKTTELYNENKLTILYIIEN